MPLFPPPQAGASPQAYGTEATYAATKNGLVTAASATDIAVISGSATKTVYVSRVEISGIATTILQTTVRLLIRTAADSGGTSTGSPVSFPCDQTDPAPTAVVLTYTANPTVNDGTDRIIRASKALFNLAAPAAGSESSKIVWTFGDRPSKAVVLRGVAQQLAINLNGVTIAGPSLDIAYEWSEK